MALLEGLDDIVRWNSELDIYECPERGVRLILSDGRTAAYDRSTIGSDEVGCKVRKQLLLDSKRDSLGDTVLYFKMPFASKTEAMIFFGSGWMVISRTPTFYM